ncbi:MAG: hypothetical protein HY047_08370, partial [Acidobacteria bacterium]|nr:hypothetical protein [Acidobacteriota bacterium]
MARTAIAGTMRYKACMGRIILAKVSPFRRLLAYVLRYRRAFLLGLACVIVTRAVALASPL